MYDKYFLIKGDSHTYTQDPPLEIGKGRTPFLLGYFYYKSVWE